MLATFLLLTVASTSRFHFSEAQQYCASGICIPENYNKYEIPPVERPLTIDTNLTVFQVLKVNEEDFTVTIFMLMVFTWPEPRLTGYDTIAKNNKTLQPLDLHLLSNVWVPDIYIYDMKSLQRSKFLTEFAGNWLKYRRDLFTGYL